MRPEPIPSDLAFTVCLTLATQGYTLFTAPQNIVNLAVLNATQMAAQKVADKAVPLYH